MPGTHKNLLIFTPEAQFGELLRISLEETGSYQVALCYTPVEVLSQLAQSPFDLLIYDTDAADPDGIAVLQQVTNNYPELPLLVFPPDNNPYHPSTTQINVWAFLNKPFYTPDLLHTVETLCRGERIIPPPPALPDAQETLQQLLVEFLHQSVAKAIWILNAGKLFMEAGDLPLSLHNSLSAYLEEQWDALVDCNERLRFVTPPPQAEEGALLFYSRPLSTQTLLVLFFPASTPLSRARHEGTSLNAALKDSPWLSTAFLLAEAHPETKTRESEGPPPESDEVLQEWLTEGNEWSENTEEGTTIDLSLLEQWLAEAPPPNPDTETPLTGPGEGDWLLEEVFALEEHLLRLDATEGVTASASEAITQSEGLSAAGIEAEPEVSGELAVESPGSPITSPTTSETVSSQPSDDFAAVLEAAVRSPVPDETQPIAIRPSSTSRESGGGTSLITIVLVPTVKDSLQNAEVSKELARWLSPWCARRGWNLKKLAITTNYALITLELAATLSPDQAVSLLCQQSSRRLFNRLEAFSTNLTSETFWSTQYLVVPGERPPDSEAIERLIVVAQSHRNHKFD